MTDKMESVNTPETYALRNLMRDRTAMFDQLESKVNEIRRLKNEAREIAQKFRSVDEIEKLNSFIDSLRD